VIDLVAADADPAKPSVATAITVITANTFDFVIFFVPLHALVIFFYMRIFSPHIDAQ
jgi:hypothetical protein